MLRRRGGACVGAGVSAGRNVTLASKPVRTPMTSWLTRPAPFAAAAVLLGLVWLAIPGIRDAEWGGPPLARWNLERDGFWLRDPYDRWIIFPGVDLQASQVSGLGLSFDAVGGDLPLAVVWRRAGDETEYSKALAHSLSRSWTYVDLSEEPNWVGEIDALGLRSLHDGPMQLKSVTLEVPGVSATLTRAWRSFWVPEIFDESAVNFRDGTRILTMGFAAALGFIVLAFLAVRIVQGGAIQRLDWRSLCIFAFGGWIVLDLRFTYDLAANAMVDRARYPSFGVADAVVSTDPYKPFADLVTAVEAHVPADARVAYLSDHWTYLIKGPFVFFPRQIFKRKKHLNRNIDYVVVFLKEGVSYLDRSHSLTIEGEKISAERIAQLDDNVGSIYRVIRRKRGGGRRVRE